MRQTVVLKRVVSPGASLPCPAAGSLSHFHSKCLPHAHRVPTDQDSDSDSDLSLDEERSLSIPSSESEENVRLRGRFQRQFKRAAHSERLLTNPANTTPKGKSQGAGRVTGELRSLGARPCLLMALLTAHRNILFLFAGACYAMSFARRGWQQPHVILASSG